MSDTLSDEAQRQIELWQKPPFDKETIEQVQNLVATNPQTLHASFYQRLSFGTGGLRGLMGVGTNRMNPYTVSAATQGLANHLIKKYGRGVPVFISYDARHHSKLFAQVAARVLAKNHLFAYLTPAPRPTPFVSFGLRHHECKAGIMITASHNPPQYNGFKVYGADGGQCTSPEDGYIIDAVTAIDDLSSVELAELDDKHIQYTTEEEEMAYFEAIRPLSLFSQQNKAHGQELCVVYSSLHGVGHTLMQKGMQLWGFVNFHKVEEQCVFDGNFTYAPDPNPEKPDALHRGIEKMLELEGDLFLANDPDADRLSATVNHRGTPFILSGNQTATLLVYSLLATFKERGLLTGKEGVVTTIVSTPLIRKISEAFGATCFETLTGFKYIGEKVKEWEQHNNPYEFVMGAEESLGYLIGTHSRDKDGIISALMLAELALHLKQQDKTLIDLLFEIYAQYGLFAEDQISLSFPPTEEGFAKMKQVMRKLREQPLTEIAQSSVIQSLDYEKGEGLNHETGTPTKLDLPKSNVLGFITADKSRYFIRPSGTEPKVKIYAMLEQTVEKPDSQALEGLKMETKKRLEQLKSLLESFAQ